MSILDTLLLAFSAYTCAILSPEPQSSLSFQHMETHLFIILLFALGFNILFLNGLINLYKWLASVVKAKLQGHRNSSLSEPDDQLEPLLSDCA